MNNIQIKEDIQEIKSLIKEAIKYLNGKTNWLKVTERDLENFFIRLEIIDNVYDLDEDDMKDKIRNKLFDRALVEVYDFANDTLSGLQNMQNEIEDEDSDEYDFYESKIELFETLRDKFDQETMQYATIDEVIEHLEEALDML